MNNSYYYKNNVSKVSTTTIKQQHWKRLYSAQAVMFNTFTCIDVHKYFMMMTMMIVTVVLLWLLRLIFCCQYFIHPIKCTIWYFIVWLHTLYESMRAVNGKRITKIVGFRLLWVALLNMLMCVQEKQSSVTFLSLSMLRFTEYSSAVMYWPVLRQNQGVSNMRNGQVGL